jgi:integrase
VGVPLGGASGLPELTVNVSIYRRGRIYWIELTSHGRRIRESAETTDKKQAQEYHEKRKSEIWRQAKLGEKPPVTWGEAVKKWMDLKPRGLPDRYRIASFGLSLTTALPLPAETITKLLSGISTAGSWNRSLALLLAIHSSSGVQPQKIKRRPMPPGRTRWLTEEEWGRLREALEAESPLLRQAAEFTLATGLRENNVLELTWEQVDLKRRMAWLEAPQVKTRRSIGVPLNDAACAVLEARRGIHKKYVFPNIDTGLPYYKASNRAWYAAVKKARLKGFRWHDLRHTWASWHVMNGTRLERLQELGGWQTLQMVRRYSHLSAEHLAEDAARVKPVSLRYNAPKRRKPDTKSPTKGG